MTCTGPVTASYPGILVFGGTTLDVFLPTENWVLELQNIKYEMETTEQ